MRLCWRPVGIRWNFGVLAHKGNVEKSVSAIHSKSLKLWEFWTVAKYVCKKVKQSHYRPGQALRVPGGWGYQISRQSAREGGKVVSPTHRPSLPPRNYSWYSFLLETESTPGPQCGQKDYVNEKLQWHHRGIEPATFWLVAQCINQLRHRVPPTLHGTLYNVLCICIVYISHSTLTLLLLCIFANSYKEKQKISASKSML